MYPPNSPIGILVLQMLFIVLMYSGCCGSSVDGEDKLSTTAISLLKVLKNNQLDTGVREDALERLLQLGEKQVVLELISVLPLEDNNLVVECSIISELGIIGDKRALPKLMELYEIRGSIESGSYWARLTHANRNKIVESGKYWARLNYTVKKLGGFPPRQ